MSYHPVSPVSICTASSLPRGWQFYERLARELGADAIHLDLTTWIGRHRPGREAKPGTLALPLGAVWVSGAFLVDRQATLANLASCLPTQDSNAATLAVTLPAAAPQATDHANVVRAQETASLLFGEGDAVVVVPACAPEGGRVHLNRLHHLRRVAEEWSVGIGFDLDQRTDSGWEAEAAVQIVGRRLRAIRVRSPLVDRSLRCVEIHRRVLRAAADQGFRGPISLVPSTPWWLGWHFASVRADLVANREAIAQLFSERHVARNRANSLRSI